MIYNFSHYYIITIMRSKNGGKAIAAGTFGCVFKPSLKCSDGREGYKNGVSKLLSIKDAKEEMEVINNVMPIISNIPNNERYFIPNVEMPFYDCMIGDLTNSDLDNSIVCKNLRYISELNQDEFDEAKLYIEKYKSNFRIIQQSYGGLELTKYISKSSNIQNMETLQIINKNLCDLMKNGIVQMNKRGLLHLDLKSQNMVIDPDTLLIRVIDWGFAKNINNYTNLNDLFGITKDNINNKIIPNLLAWTVMFNVPPSSILFDKSTVEFIDKYYNGNNLQRILDVIYSNHEDDGHFPIILKNIRVLGFTTPDQQLLVWAKFLAEIISKYTKNSKFDAFKYFEEVYRHNVDIFSVLLTYINLIETEKIPNQYLPTLKNICYRYMYSPEIAVTKIDVNKLTEELTNLFGKPAKSERTAISKKEKSMKQAGPTPIKGLTPNPITAKSIKSIKRAGPTPFKFANENLALLEDYFQGGKRKIRKTSKPKHKTKTRKQKRKTRLIQRKTR